MRQEQLSVVIDAQQRVFLDKQDLIIREALQNVPIVDNYATIITGIRRCGKSTLLLQLLKSKYTEVIYLNFEDIRLVAFNIEDFIRLQQEIDKRSIRVLFFDEIQIVDKWEIFVNQLLREGYTVFVTGSNASLLSKELGTHLTGRHLSMELFPFSYREFITYKETEADQESLKDYLVTGGMPEYVKSGQALILGSLMDDILVRDISVRHSVRDIDSLKQLAIYLISNVGVLVSANKLTGLFGIKSSTTILEYFNYFKDAYLVEFVPRFDYSIKVQARNPKKIYVMDTGLINVVSTSFTEDLGRKLENMVYLHLRRTYSTIYYFAEKGECDFVVFEKGKIVQAIQVCYTIDDFNFEREYSGLVAALHYFKVNHGFIVTLNQEDIFEKDGLTIEMIPAYKYFIRKE
ncbi:ATPase component BioM of energizing module of biotin ECF transporter [Sphingobacterium sp. JB170]|nr:ATPase component BioM of energizing module of biotin ECF transporter [Sphingobacterium sp. JB170]